MEAQNFDFNWLLDKTPNFRVGLITPEIAQELLNRMIPNRRLSEKRVIEYTRAMKESQWGFHSEICFNSNGLLYDGQHRLRALIKAGICLIFGVKTGMPEDAVEYCDIGMNRSAGNIAAIKGLPYTSSHLAIAKLLLYNLKQSSSVPSPQRLFKICEIYSQGIDFALNLSSSKIGSCKSSIKSAIASAFYYENQDRLEEFMSVYKTGSQDDGDSAAVTIARIASQTKERSSQVVSYSKVDLLLKACKAIYLFCKKEKISRIQSTLNCYPLLGLILDEDLELVNRTKKGNFHKYLPKAFFDNPYRL